MTACSIALEAALYFLAGFVYLRRIVRSASAPTIGMWLLFSVATFLNSLSIFIAAKGKLLSNLYSYGDFVMSATILLTLLTRTKVRLARFEVVYLGIAAVIVGFWCVSGSAVTANLLVQGLILVGYVPAIHKMIATKRNTEAFDTWLLFLLAGAVSLYPAYAENNLLSVIYSWRTVIMISVMLVLMTKYERRRRIGTA